MWVENSPPRSPSNASTGAGWVRDYNSPGRESSIRDCSPTNSVTSSRTATSVVSTKTGRVLRDLKVELELKDHRIGELERSYEEVQRKSEYKQGQLQRMLDDQCALVKKLQNEQENFQTVIGTQSTQIGELMSVVTQCNQMQQALKATLQRCDELESLVAKSQVAQRESVALPVSPQSATCQPDDTSSKPQQRFVDPVAPAVAPHYNPRTIPRTQPPESKRCVIM